MYLGFDDDALLNILQIMAFVLYTLQDLPTTTFLGVFLEL
jgi:hypothetical protein